ncbi:MAG: TetR/AcrR family transcriptional regulator [Lachnospiraceae bacterium]|nr:TetR/AcrR family transcriptional regulator [Lachnospiraceae bacterium]
MSLETFENLPAHKKELILSIGIKEFSLKSYKDVSTDGITKKCQISKGILFHYFGSKKQYYLYCLEKAMERLVSKTENVMKGDFYEILFSSMNRKIAICMQYKDEMHMVNMASRDAAVEIADGKAEIMQRYRNSIQLESDEILKMAVATLEFKDESKIQAAITGLHIYTNAVLNKYLLQYQQTPEQFLEHSEKIKEEMKEYLDMMLYGICK